MASSGILKAVTDAEFTAPKDPPTVRRRRCMWDVMPDNPRTDQLALRTPPAPPAFTHHEGLTSKKYREVFLGNLCMGKVTACDIKDKFLQFFQALPQYVLQYPKDVHPVTNITFPTSAVKGLYAFVELINPTLASTALNFNGFELYGRQIKVNRPQGYVIPPQGEVPSFDVTPLRTAGLVPKLSIHENEYLREMYFGNLAADAVNEDVIKELLTPVCFELPMYDPMVGPPITRVTMGHGNRYCFVQFQSIKMAERIQMVFNDTDFLGRVLRVVRPQKAQAMQGSDHASNPQVDVHKTEAFRAGQAAVAALNCL